MRRVEDSTMSDEKCGEPAASFIPRWGMYFTCVLPKGHEGEHRQGGTCFKHGEYVGEKCPKWPDCSAPAYAAAQLAEKEREPKTNCCGDAHMELEAAMHMLETLGFKKETQPDGHTHVWRNLRAEAAEQRLQEAQADTQHWQTRYQTDHNVIQSLQDGLADLREQLRLREAELEQRWIAVEERLPICGEWHLDDKVAPLEGSRGAKAVLACQSGKVYWAQFSENTDDGGQTVSENGWSDITSDEMIKPTHWQPLPSPPKVQP